MSNPQRIECLESEHIYVLNDLVKYSEQNNEVAMIVPVKIMKSLLLEIGLFREERRVSRN